MKAFPALLAALLIAASASAIPIIGLFPTGYGDKGLLPVGSTDQHYKLDGGVAFVATPAVPWLHSATARWLCPTANGNAAVAALPRFDYATTFVLPKDAALESVSLTISATADDGVIIWLNGKDTQLPTVQKGFAEFNTFRITGKGSPFFVNGTNRLVFLVNNAPEHISTPTPSGLIVGAISGTFSLSTSTVAGTPTNIDIGTTSSNQPNDVTIQTNLQGEVVTITNLAGRVYVSIRIAKVVPDGFFYTFMDTSMAGGGKILFKDLSESWQVRFNYSHQKADNYQAKQKLKEDRWKAQQAQDLLNAQANALYQEKYNKVKDACINESRRIDGAVKRGGVGDLQLFSGYAEISDLGITHYRGNTSYGGLGSWMNENPIAGALAIGNICLKDYPKADSIPDGTHINTVGYPLGYYIKAPYTNPYTWDNKYESRPIRYYSVILDNAIKARLQSGN